MTQLLKRLFGKREPKPKLEKPVVLTSSIEKKYTPQSKQLSLSKFVEMNSNHIKLNVRLIRKWYLEEGFLSRSIIQVGNEDTYVCTSDGKKFGISTRNFTNQGKTKTGIFLYESAQQKTLKHFTQHQPVTNSKSIEVNPIIPIYKIEDLKIDDPYFDTVLKDIDKNIKLDLEQRTAIISNQDNVLIVAGAGAGKTTTMAAKVKYLVDKQGVKPEEIIVISYTNKAINELRERINRKLKIPVNIATFHAFAFDIVKRTKDTAPTISYTSYNYINDYLEKVIFNDPQLLRKLVLFLGYYFDLNEDTFKYNTLNDYIDAKSVQEYETLKSGLGEYVKAVSNQRERYQKTIRGEYLRSAQEVQLANFFYLNNIDYEYEKIYPVTIQKSKKPYTPDFFLKQGEHEAYLEHYGITENHHHSLYSPEQLKKYVHGIEFKRHVHASNKTTLLETYSEYNDRRSLMDHAADVLRSNGFVLAPRDPKEIYTKIVETGKDKYVYKFIFFVKEFIELYKTKGLKADGFEELRRKTDNVRSLMFLDIAEGVYSYYQECLKKKNEIDFADMINDAADFLGSSNFTSLNLPYKYIIIDEFQDIAKQRFDFAKVLAERTDAKITAVGDDWQSIFAFAGSDITLFTKFIKLMGSGEELKITHTYRNSQQLIDIAGGFVQKNSNQIKKSLISPKQLIDPIKIIDYDDSYKTMKALADKTTEVVGEIFNRNKNADILLLGRYNFDLYKLSLSGAFVEGTSHRIKCTAYPDAKLTFLTTHSAKGLGYDEVIIINMIEGRFGFPSQIENDPIMKLVVNEDRGINFSEERRLFYVALTRTKNNVYLMTPKTKPSRFVLELIKDHKLKHAQDLNLQLSEKTKYRCPECGSPLKYSPNNSFGLFLHICTNEPELCSFMTNEPKAMKDIYKCEKCSDGFMIAKKVKNTEKFVYGCTNYKNEKNPCSNIK